ncbi:MAG TPA: hypothetical protein VII72_02565 [Myxococcota bacterium]|jgi:hypothetical protein
MRLSCEVDLASRLVLLRVSGELDDEGLLALAAQLRSEPDVKPDFALLIDLREASGLAVTGTGVRALVAEPLVLAPTSRRAVVVPTDLGFGMARMYEMLRDERGGVTRAFRDFDEARRWVTSRD